MYWPRKLGDTLAQREIKRSVPFFLLVELIWVYKWRRRVKKTGVWVYVGIPTVRPIYIVDVCCGISLGHSHWELFRAMGWLMRLDLFPCPCAGSIAVRAASGNSE